MGVANKMGGLLLTAWLLAFPQVGCGDAMSQTPTPGASAACDRSPPLTYESYGRGFMTQNCVPCHHALLPEDDRNGAPLGVNFETYAKVLTWADRIEVRTLSQETMPPGGGLSADELARFEEWLACGVAEDKATLEAEAALGHGGMP